MNEVWNPVQVENSIREVVTRIANSVKTCDERYRTFQKAEHAYEVAYAHAYMSHQGAAHEKKYAAVLETQKEREARDVADAAYKYVDRLAKSLESELRAWQSVGASIRAAYGVAGRGEQ